MPKGFSEEEKEKIQERLKNIGKEHFGRLGLRKTTVQELAEAAGIAKGSFYLFYKTKEELFVTILEEVEQELQNQMMKEFLTPGKAPKEIFKKVLLKQLKTFDRTPLLKNIMNPREFEYLRRKAPPGWIEKSSRIDENFMKSILELWKGRMRDIPPGVLSSLFRGIVIMMLHREELEHFDTMLSLLIDALGEKIFL